MKIEALEDLKSDGYVLTAGDTITVPDSTGAFWCKAGWARDVAGEIPTGERQVLNAKLAVDSVKTTVKSADAGVKSPPSPRSARTTVKSADAGVN